MSKCGAVDVREPALAGAFPDQVVALAELLIRLADADILCQVAQCVNQRDGLAPFEVSQPSRSQRQTRSQAG